MKPLYKRCSVSSRTAQVRRARVFPEGAWVTVTFLKLRALRTSARDSSNVVVTQTVTVGTFLPNNRSKRGGG